MLDAWCTQLISDQACTIRQRNNTNIESTTEYSVSAFNTPNDSHAAPLLNTTILYVQSKPRRYFSSSVRSTILLFAAVRMEAVPCCHVAVVVLNIYVEISVQRCYFRLLRRFPLMRFNVQRVANEENLQDFIFTSDLPTPSHDPPSCGVVYFCWGCVWSLVLVVDISKVRSYVRMLGASTLYPSYFLQWHDLSELQSSVLYSTQINYRNKEPQYSTS